MNEIRKTGNPLSILKKRKTACAIMAVMIVVSVAAGSRSSLTKLYTEAAEKYESDKSETFTIKEDVERIYASGTNLTVVAGRYLEEDDFYLLNLQDALAGIASSERPRMVYQAVEDVVEATERLNEELNKIKLTDEDARYQTICYGDIISYSNTAKKSDYNTLAADFNQELNKYPAKLLNIFAGLKTLELYE